MYVLFHRYADITYIYILVLNSVEESSYIYVFICKISNVTDLLMFLIYFDSCMYVELYLFSPAASLLRDFSLLENVSFLAGKSVIDIQFSISTGLKGKRLTRIYYLCT